MNKRFTTRRIALCGLLLSMMLILGWVEKQIALPSGIKLGLSNSVLLFAVYMLDLPTAVVLMILKVTLTNLLFGNFCEPITDEFLWDGGLFRRASALALARRKKLAGPKIHRFGGLQFPIAWLVYVVWRKNDKLVQKGIPLDGVSLFRSLI